MENNIHHLGPTRKVTQMMWQSVGKISKNKTQPSIPLKTKIKQIRPLKTKGQTIMFWTILSYTYLYVSGTTRFPMMYSNQIYIY